jgi:cobalt transporter subunit CbtB
MNGPLSASRRRLPEILGAFAGVLETEALRTAMIATLFGAFLLFGVGFAHSDRLHAAAHDTRHAFTFPCH